MPGEQILIDSAASPKLVQKYKQLKKKIKESQDLRNMNMLNKTKMSQNKITLRINLGSIKEQLTSCPSPALSYDSSSLNDEYNQKPTLNFDSDTSESSLTSYPSDTSNPPTRGRSFERNSLLYYSSAPKSRSISCDSDSSMDSNLSISTLGSLDSLSPDSPSYNVVPTPVTTDSEDIANLSSSSSITSSPVNIEIQKQEEEEEEEKEKEKEALMKEKIEIELKKKMEAQIKEKMEAQIKEKLEAQIKEKMEAQIKEKMEAQIKEKMEAQIKEKLEAQMKMQQASTIPSPGSSENDKVISNNNDRARNNYPYDSGRSASNRARSRSRSPCNNNYSRNRSRSRSRSYSRRSSRSNSYDHSRSRSRSRSKSSRRMRYGKEDDYHRRNSKYDRHYHNRSSRNNYYYGNNRRQKHYEEENEEEDDEEIISTTNTIEKTIMEDPRKKPLFDIEQTQIYRESASYLETEFYKKTIYLGDLEENTPESVIRQIFSSFGEIREIKIFPGKQYAFISYKSAASALEAIKKMNGYPLGSSIIKVGKAKIPERNKYGFGNRPWQDDDGAMAMTQDTYGFEYINNNPNHSSSVANFSAYNIYGHRNVNIINPRTYQNSSMGFVDPRANNRNIISYEDF